MILSAVLLFFAAACTGQLEEDSTEQRYQDPEALQELISSDQPYLLVDVRRDDEYQRGYIPTAVHIPVDQIEASPPEVPTDSLVILYCQSGVRSARAERILQELGYSNLVDFGGIIRWPYELESPTP